MEDKIFQNIISLVSTDDLEQQIAVTDSIGALQVKTSSVTAQTQLQLLTQFYSSHNPSLAAVFSQLADTFSTPKQVLTLLTRLAQYLRLNRSFLSPRSRTAKRLDITLALREKQVQLHNMVESKRKASEILSAPERYKTMLDGVVDRVREKRTSMCLLLGETQQKIDRIQVLQRLIDVKTDAKETLLLATQKLYLAQFTAHIQIIEGKKKVAKHVLNRSLNILHKFKSNSVIQCKSTALTNIYYNQQMHKRIGKLIIIIQANKIQNVQWIKQLILIEYLKIKKQPLVEKAIKLKYDLMEQLYNTKSALNYYNSSTLRTMQVSHTFNIMSAKSNSIFFSKEVILRKLKIFGLLHKMYGSLCLKCLIQKQQSLVLEQHKIKSVIDILNQLTTYFNISKSSNCIIVYFSKINIIKKSINALKLAIVRQKIISCKIIPQIRQQQHKLLRYQRQNSDSRFIITHKLFLRLKLIKLQKYQVVLKESKISKTYYYLQTLNSSILAMKQQLSKKKLNLGQKLTHQFSITRQKYRNMEFLNSVHKNYLNQTQNLNIISSIKIMNRIDAYTLQRQLLSCRLSVTYIRVYYAIKRNILKKQKFSNIGSVFCQKQQLKIYLIHKDIIEFEHQRKIVMKLIKLKQQVFKNLKSKKILLEAQCISKNMLIQSTRELSMIRKRLGKL